MSQVSEALFDLEKYPDWSDSITKVKVTERDEGGRVTGATLTISAGALKDEVSLTYNWDGAPQRLEFELYLLGGATTNWLSWQVPSILGIFFAESVPAQWGIGFAGTLALLGVGLSLVSDRTTALAGVVAGCAAVAAYALPLKMNILVAIAAAVAIGVLMDHAGPKKPARAQAVAPPPPAPGGPEDRS